MPLRYRIYLIVSFTLLGISFSLCSSAHYRLFVYFVEKEGISEKAVHLVGMGTVQGESGQLYLYSEDSLCKEDCWQRVDKIPDRVEIGSSAQELDCLPHPDLEAFVEVQGMCTYYFYSTKLDIWAIDSEGKVQFCQNGQPNKLQLWMVAPFNGAMVGFTFGCLVVVGIGGLQKWARRRSDKVNCQSSVHNRQS